MDKGYYRGLIMLLASLLGCGGDEFRALRTPQSDFHNTRGGLDADVASEFNWQLACGMAAAGEPVILPVVEGASTFAGLGPFASEMSLERAVITISGSLCLPRILPAAEDVMVLVDASEAMEISDPVKGGSCIRQAVLDRLNEILGQEFDASGGSRRFGVGVFSDRLWRKSAGVFQSLPAAIAALNYRTEAPAAERFCVGAPGDVDWQALASASSTFFESFGSEERQRRLIVLTGSPLDDAAALRAAAGVDSLKVVAIGTDEDLSAEVGDPALERFGLGGSGPVEAVVQELFPHAARMTLEGRGIARPQHSWQPLFELTGEAQKADLGALQFDVEASWGYEIRVRCYDDADEKVCDSLGVLSWR